MEDNNNHENSNVTQQKTQKQNNSSCLWISIAFLTAGLFVMLGIIAGGAYWYYHSQKMVLQSTKNEIVADLLKDKATNKIVSEKKVDTNNTQEIKTVNSEYKNDEFGFALDMLSGWEDYKAEQVMLGGDFNVAEVNFYLPSKAIGNSTDMPGYMHMFTISIYITESWEDPLRDHSNDEMLGEVIGSNDFYTFVYSHFNGVPPTDISQEAVLNMDKIAKNIKTFQSDTSAYDDSDEFFGDVDYDQLYFEKYPYNEVYANNSIEYWNCMYRYKLNYPVTWSNNGMSNMSDTVVLRDDGIITTIRVEDATGLSDEEFFKKEYKKEFPKAVLEPEGDRLLMPETNTIIYHLAFASPYERRLYWKVTEAGEEEKEVGIVITIEGSKFMNEWDNIMNMLGTLEVNTFMEECVS